MKEFGKQSKKTLANIKLFFGDKFEGRDSEKYAYILNYIPYPELADDPEDVLNDLYAKAEEELSGYIPAEKKGRFHKGISITRLGKPMRNQHKDPQVQMEQLAQQMGRVLAGYEEVLELSVFQGTDDSNEYGTFFRLATEEMLEGQLSSLVRGVYSQVKTVPFSDGSVQYPNTLYATLSVPYRDLKQEEGKKQETYDSNWVDAVFRSLPGEGAYRITIRIVPLEPTDRLIADKMERIQSLSDQMLLYGEAEWNQSTNLGANYTRQKNIIKNIAQNVKATFAGSENVSGNFGESFGVTRRQKNKKVQLLVQQLDQMLYRLGKAGQTKPWQVVISAEAEDEDVLQTVCVSLSGALKANHYVIDWGQEYCLAALLSTEELLPLLRFPTREFAGFEFVDNEEFSLVSPTNVREGMDIGNLLWNSVETSKFYLPNHSLNRHAFICGMTGAGKTNTLFKILEEAQVPFLVIEPVKGEYRSLAASYEELHIWSMKAEHKSDTNIDILRINPFWFPDNTNIAFHVDSIKTIIASAFELSNAMPNILEQCMYNIYIKAGWNIITNKNRYAGTIPNEFLYPTFLDLVDEVEDYLDHSKFVGETLGDYHGAMTTRLKSFVNSYKGLLLNTEVHPDYEEMMKRRTIIELEGLADDADKCLVMGTILVQYFEYLKLHFTVSDKKLQHLLVIEEAHRLFKNVEKKVSGAGQSADPTGQLVESLSNIMAEIRAFGEGLLIVDQSPSKIAEDVIKNSSTKIIHRIDNEKDIKLLQSALLIPDDKTSLPALAQGEALIRTEGMKRPCKVKIYCSDVKENYHLSDSFQHSGVANAELEYAFAAMAILSDDTIADGIRTAIWCFLIELERDALNHWKRDIDKLLHDMIKVLMERRRYDLVNGKMDIVRQLIAQSVRQLRSGTLISIGVNELAEIHLFLQRLLDFYGEEWNNRPVKKGNLILFERFFVNKIAPLVCEYVQRLCADELIGSEKVE